MRRFNTEEFIKFIIFITFNVLLCYLLKTGKINGFINPKMSMYIKITVVAIFILALFQFTKIFTVMTRNKFRVSYLMFFAVILIGFTTVPGNLNGEITDNKGVTIANSNNDSSARENINKDITGDVILFQDHNYYENIFKLEGNVQQYIGKKVIIKGFVYKEEGFEENEFVVARMMMSCCAADAQVIGLMCRWDNAPQLNREQWISVEGTLESTTYGSGGANKGDIIPLIVVQKIESIEAPENVYIYP